MSPGVYNTPHVVVTELGIADAFVKRYFRRIFVGRDEGFVVNSLYQEVGSQQRLIAKGADVDDAYVLYRIKQLVIELTQGADAATKIRAQSHAFCVAVLNLIRDHVRLALPPYRDDEPRLADLDALMERNVEHFREAQHV